ncbi:MAG: SdpI family protein [Candidatus Woesearchaeota archaeon]
MKSKKQPFYDKKKLLIELVPLTFIVIMFGVALYVHPMLPDKIPTHWNAAGQVDNYSGKDGVFFIPVVFLVISTLLFVLPLMEVFRDNMLKIYDYYYMFKIIFGVFFLVLFAATLAPNFGYDINVAYIVLSMISIMFIGLGLILPKLKRNFMFGIRTGWTLSSDRVWEKTHKIGGILFISVGILTLIFSFLLALEVMFFVFIGLVMLISIFLVFYSYYLYKNERSTKK